MIELPQLPSAELRFTFLCNPYHRGGIERWMADMARAWRAASRQFWFIAPRPRIPFHNAGSNQSVSSLLNETLGQPNGSERVEPDVGPEFEFGTEAYRASVYARAILENVPAGIAVITSDDRATWRAGSWLARRNPLILIVHGDYEGYYRRVEQFATYAAAIVSISHRIDKRVRALTLRKGLHYAHIPLGLPLPQSLSREMSGSCSPVRLIWVGRMDESAKRLSDLPQIAQQLLCLGIEFHLSLVGDGPGRRSLERGVMAGPLRDRTQFHGWVDSSHVRRMLEQADVLLLPSNREGLPVVMMEALAAGCVVVASRVSGVEDYESHPLAKQCLWVHTVGDVEGAANSVIEAITVPPAVRMQRARALAEAEFAIDRCAERYAALISRLAPPSVVGESTWKLKLRAIGLGSAPVAAQRRLRLWVAGR